MNLTAALLAPLALLISAVGGDQDRADVSALAAEGALAQAAGMQDAPDWPIAALPPVEPRSAWQVHIEQRMTIRISPRAAPPQPRDMFTSLPEGGSSQRFSERKIGKCLPIGGIVGVEPNGPNNLVLFMRDRRMINAQLERSCRSRAFYSGFYLSRSTDGMICVDRDTLLSRSGSACKLSRIRQLVERDD